MVVVIEQIRMMHDFGPLKLIGITWSPQDLAATPAPMGTLEQPVIIYQNKTLLHRFHFRHGTCKRIQILHRHSGGSHCQHTQHVSRRHHHITVYLISPWFNEVNLKNR